MKLGTFFYGRLAEKVCIWTLRAKGYRILKERYRTQTGEIDIIARRWNTLCFIEVKARPTLDQALNAIGTRQRRRIENTALCFLAHYPWTGCCRFDVFCVMPWKFPYHLKNAWMVDHPYTIFRK